MDDSDSSQKDMQHRPFGHACFYADRHGENGCFGDPFQVRAEPFEDGQTLIAGETIWHRDDTCSLTAEIIPHRGRHGTPQKTLGNFTQQGGKSSLIGEVWMLKQKRLLALGERGSCCHPHHYSFYNPQIHSSFVNEKSPFLLLRRPHKCLFKITRIDTSTRLHQILYRLDFDTLGFD